MNENKELAQKIIDKYVTIFGSYPVYLFCSQIPELKVNNKGKLISIRDGKSALLKLINALEPFSGKFIKASIIKKFLESYDAKKDIV